MHVDTTLSLSCIAEEKDIVVIWSEDILNYDNIVAFEVGASLINNCSLLTFPLSSPLTFKNISQTSAEFSGLQPGTCYLFAVRAVSHKLAGNWSLVTCSTSAVYRLHTLPPSAYMYLVMICFALVIIVSIILGSLLYVVYR